MKVEFDIGDFVTFIDSEKYADKPFSLKRGEIIAIWTRNCKTPKTNQVTDVDYQIEYSFWNGFATESKKFTINQSQVYKNKQEFLKYIGDIDD